MQRIASNAASFETAADSSASRIPWYCFGIVFGAACIPIGALWDISWHSTIGRDTFWTPAHMLIYIGGVLPGLSAGMALYRSTFLPDSPEHLASLKLLGVRGPVGAWVTVWGTLAMLVSAPFDNWWHNAYGLDVEILSPPHAVLALGMYAVAVGALLLIVSWQNRMEGVDQQKCSYLFLFTAGVVLTMSTIIVTEKSFPNQQHGAAFYKASAFIYPLYLVAVARASKTRWSATITAAIYMAIKMAMVWILPLFTASPKLAPIYNPVTHMVPPQFPLLLVGPALCVDLLIQWTGAKGRKPERWWMDWWLCLAIGVAFMAAFIGIHWNFAAFQMSPAARNWFFASNEYWPYWVRPGDWRFNYWRVEEDALTVGAITIAVLIATAKTRIALALGNWMTAVRR